MAKGNNYGVKPFPPDWLELFDVETLERLAIMTVDGGLTDSEALTMLAKEKMRNEDHELATTLRI